MRFSCYNYVIMEWIVDKTPPAAYDENGLELPAYGIKIRGLETRLFCEPVIAKFVLKEQDANKDD